MCTHECSSIYIVRRGFSDYFRNTLSPIVFHRKLYYGITSFLANYLWMIKFSVQKYSKKEKKYENVKHAKVYCVLKCCTHRIYSHQIASNSIFCRGFRITFNRFRLNIRHFSVLNVVMKLFLYFSKERTS